MSTPLDRRPGGASSSRVPPPPAAGSKRKRKSILVAAGNPGAGIGATATRSRKKHAAAGALSETERKLYAACHPEVLGDLQNKLDTARVVHAHLVLHHSRVARQSSTRVRKKEDDSWVDGLLSSIGYAAPAKKKETINLGRVCFCVEQEQG